MLSRTPLAPVTLAFSLCLLASCIPEDGTDTPDAGAQADAGAEADTGGQTDAGDHDAYQDPDPYADLPPQPWPALEPGPLGIGYRNTEFTYDARGDEEPRTLPLSIWYPTLDTAGETALYGGIVQRPQAFEEATPTFSGPAPIMLFSHGHQAVNWQSYYWMEYLASHGWIVAAPDHVFGTFFDIPEGNQLKSALFRGEDLSATLDYLQALPDEDPLSAGISDLVAASGHSFGGLTMFAVAGATFNVDDILEACASGETTGRICLLITEDTAPIFREGYFDERIRAVIPKTSPGAEVFGEGVATVQTPVLFWTAGRDATLPNEEEGDPIWQSLPTGDHRRVDVLNAGHFSFSNMCDFFGGLDWIRDDGCGADFASPDHLHPLVNAYSLNFLRYHLALAEPDDTFDVDAPALDPQFIHSFK